MSYMNHADFASSGAIAELSFDEIDLVCGGDVNWKAVAKFAGKAAGYGVRAGAWGLAGAAVAVAVYVAVEALD
jgi:hypothetical protein